MDNTIADILIGKGEHRVAINPALANRHGLVAGATGTGKSVTLKILAEGFSDIGVPVFLADAKGDLAGISQAGDINDRLLRRAGKIGMSDYTGRAYPTVLWDLLGEQGEPVRTTVSDMGPLLLSRLLDLTDAQEGVMTIVFCVADDQGLLLLDLKDLRALLTFVGENRKELAAEYGTFSNQSLGAIQRKLLGFEQQGADQFFGEPALELDDLMTCAADGRGQINILSAERLMQQPKLYATFMLWLLAELFEQLPEVGDPDKPKLVFFFDEAHLLFRDAPSALLQKVEQVVRLIRSKGVGVYFITQSPGDIPDAVLGQLGNRVQHALRAFTPRDKKMVRTAANTFRANPAFDVEQVITQLEVGEALVSTLDEKGAPSVVERALVRPPCSRMGPITEQERRQLLAGSAMGAKYRKTIDRESAYERLREQAEKRVADEAALEEKRDSRGNGDAGRRRSGRSRQGVMETMAKSVARTIGSQLGRRIVRGILGSLFKG